MRRAVSPFVRIADGPKRQHVRGRAPREGMRGQPHHRLELSRRARDRVRDACHPALRRGRAIGNRVGAQSLRVRHRVRVPLPRSHHAQARRPRSALGAPRPERAARPCRAQRHPLLAHQARQRGQLRARAARPPARRRRLLLVGRRLRAGRDAVVPRRLPRRRLVRRHRRHARWRLLRVRLRLACA